MEGKLNSLPVVLFDHPTTHQQRLQTAVYMGHWLTVAVHCYKQLYTWAIGLPLLCIVTNSCILTSWLTVAVQDSTWKPLSVNDCVKLLEQE